MNEPGLPLCVLIKDQGCLKLLLLTFWYLDPQHIKNFFLNVIIPCANLYK